MFLLSIQHRLFVCLYFTLFGSVSDTSTYEISMISSLARAMILCKLKVEGRAYIIIRSKNAWLHVCYLVVSNFVILKEVGKYECFSQIRKSKYSTIKKQRLGDGRGSYGLNVVRWFKLVATKVVGF